MQACVHLGRRRIRAGTAARAVFFSPSE